MINQTISHYPALWDFASMRDSRKRNKILEKLGEVPIRLNLANGPKLSSSVGMWLPPSFGGSGGGGL